MAMVPEAQLMAFVLLGPLMLLVACAVRLNSPGAALFKQARLGRNARPFVAYKFRTMYTGAPDLRNSDGSTFNAAADPRVTRVGRILRQTSLDELPQLFNVLCGDMSLVGPRPERPEIIESRGLARLVPGYTERLSVRPAVGRGTFWLSTAAATGSSSAL